MDIHFIDVHFKDGSRVEIKPDGTIHTWPAPNTDSQACAKIAKAYINAPEPERQRDELLATLANMAEIVHWGGRYHLKVAGLILATEGDVCRDGINPELSSVTHWNKEAFDKVIAAIARAHSDSEDNED